MSSEVIQLRTDLRSLEDEPDVIHISEIFVSIQGEGKFLGVPSVFVRTAVCNLRCIWCDTKYSWKSATYKYTVTDLVNKIFELTLDTNITHVVFTGGEPMLQYKNLCNVIEALPFDYTFTFETNGTIIPEKMVPSHNILFSVSPKLSSAYPRPDKAPEYNVNYNEWKKIEYYHVHMVRFKYVLDEQSIPEFVNKHYMHIKNAEEIFVMHVTDLNNKVDYINNFANMKHLAQKLMAYPNIRVLPRLHLYYFKGERGY